MLADGEYNISRGSCGDFQDACSFTATGGDAALVNEPRIRTAIDSTENTSRPKMLTPIAGKWNGESGYRRLTWHQFRA